jgi:hypothetical protein
MTRRGATFAIVFLAGCASDKQTDAPGTAPRGPRHRVPTEEVAAPQRVAEPEPWDPYGGTQANKPAPAIKKVAAEDERDYGAELLSAIGSPVNCLKSRIGKEAPTEIQISLQANVVETGVVTRGYAHSTQLEDAELECVQARLGSLRLRAPIPGAPRTVNATLELKQPPSAKPGPEKAAEGDDPREAEQEQLPAEPREDTQREIEPREDTQREVEPREDTQREIEPREDTQREVEPREDTLREDTPREDTPREDTRYDDTAQPPE